MGSNKEYYCAFYYYLLTPSYKLGQNSSYFFANYVIEDKIRGHHLQLWVVKTIFMVSEWHDHISSSFFFSFLHRLQKMYAGTKECIGQCRKPKQKIRWNFIIKWTSIIRYTEFQHWSCRSCPLKAKYSFDTTWHLFWPTKNDKKKQLWKKLFITSFLST